MKKDKEFKGLSLADKEFVRNVFYGIFIGVLVVLMYTIGGWLI